MPPAVDELSTHAQHACAFRAGSKREIAGEPALFWQDGFAVFLGQGVWGVWLAMGRA